MGPAHPDPQVGPTGPLGATGAMGSTGPQGPSLIDYMYSQDSQVSALTFNSVPVIPSLQAWCDNRTTNKSSVIFKGAYKSPVVDGDAFTYSYFRKLEFENSSWNSIVANSIRKVTVNSVGQEVAVSPGSPTPLTITVSTGTLPDLQPDLNIGLHVFTDATTRTIQLKSQPFAFDGGLTHVPLPASDAREGVTYLLSDGLDMRSYLTIGGYTAPKSAVQQVQCTFRRDMRTTACSEFLTGYTSYSRDLIRDGSRVFSSYSRYPRQSELVQGLVIGSVDNIEPSVSVINRGSEPVFTADNTALSYPLIYGSNMEESVTVSHVFGLYPCDSGTHYETGNLKVSYFEHTIHEQADEVELSPTDPSFVLAKVRHGYVEELVFLLGCTYDNDRIYAQAVAKIDLHTHHKMTIRPIVNSFIYSDYSDPTRLIYATSGRYPTGANYSVAIDHSKTYRYSPCSHRVFLNYVDKLRKEVRSEESYNAWWNTYGGHYRDYQPT